MLSQKFYVYIKILGFHLNTVPIKSDFVWSYCKQILQKFNDLLLSLVYKKYFNMYDWDTEHTNLQLVCRKWKFGKNYVIFIHSFEKSEFACCTYNLSSCNNIDV